MRKAIMAAIIVAFMAFIGIGGLYTCHGQQSWTESEEAVSVVIDAGRKLAMEDMKKILPDLNRYDRNRLISCASAILKTDNMKHADMVAYVMAGHNPQLAAAAAEGFYIGWIIGACLVPGESM